MVTDFYQPFVGGVEVVVQSLAHELAGRGHEVSVATLRANALPEFEADGPVRVHRIPASAGRIAALFSQRRAWAPPIPDPEATLGLARVVDAERPDIVHGHDWLARSFLPIRRKSATRFVMSLHYYTVSCAKKNLMYEGSPCTGPAAVKCLRCAGRHYGMAKGSVVVLGNFGFARRERRAVDLFLPVSEATASGNGLRERKSPYEVIPNFVRAQPPLPDDARLLVERLPQRDFLLYVGDLRREKGVHVLLDAYRGLTDVPPLVLIGKSWPEWSPELPPNSSAFLDWPNTAVREAQKRCLALIVPSVWPEPFGMVVIETFAAGRPVIASGIGGLADLVVHDVNGLSVRPGDAVALRKAIWSLVDDDRVLARLSLGARRSAEAFTPEAIVPRFEAAYAGAYDRSPTAP